MDDCSQSLEEQADEILQQDAKRRGTTLYREGIISKKRWRVIRAREIPLSFFERKTDEQ